jgi:RNA polymerase sigma-70 factor (ECF subfamily)
MGPDVPEPVAGNDNGYDAEHSMVLADSVGIAMLVVLETLEPAERLAFVLHDMFDVPFDEIAPIVGRSTEAARQLASRARRRVQGKTVDPAPDRTRHREIVDAFLTASRGGDINALLALLDPDVVFRADPAAVRLGGLPEVRGAAAVAQRFNGTAQAAHPALVDGALGAVVTPGGRLLLVLGITIANGRITAIDAIADPNRLGRLDLEVLGD